MNVVVLGGNCWRQIGEEGEWEDSWRETEVWMNEKALFGLGISKDDVRERARDRTN